MNAYQCTTRGTGNETYFDSAEGYKLTKQRAIIELKRHGITATEEINQFFRDMGVTDRYDAQAVLVWLGY